MRDKHEANLSFLLRGTIYQPNFWNVEFPGFREENCGVQNESPQDVPLQYADCFKLMVTLATSSTVTSAPFMITWENLN